MASGAVGSGLALQLCRSSWVRGELGAEGWHVVFGRRGRKSNNRRQLAGPKVNTMGSLQAPSGPAPTFDDVWRVFQETNTRFQATDRRFKATERVMKERAAETDRIVKDQSKSVGALGNRLGLFALVQSGDSVKIRNDARFAPKVW